MNVLKPLIRYFWPLGFLLGSTIPFGISMCAAEIPGYPANINAYDAREIAMLPRYCIYAQSFRETVQGGNNPAEIRRWISVMGDTFQHIHHYCWGMMNSNRATILARSRQDRERYLGQSLVEFDYVIQRAPSDFVLLPEIFSKKGENLLRLGKTAPGIADLRRAIELKPEYWPPSEVLSDHYKATGDLAKAREVLEKALSFSPESKSLKLRLAELDAATDKRKPPTDSIKSPQTAKP